MTDRETVRNEHDGKASGRRRLDLRGLRCPLPVLKIRKALLALPPGGEVEALCDDPLAALDVPNFLREERHDLLETRREASAGELFVIRKGTVSP